MKRLSGFSLIVLACFISTSIAASPSLYKQKKYFGPISPDNFNFSIGFIDGPNADYLNEYLHWWAQQDGGEYIYDDITTVAYASAGYERMISPLHFLRATLAFTYLKSSGSGDYYTVDPILHINADRTFKVYYLSLDLGFAYYMVEPEVRALIPYISGGFSSVFPLMRLETDAELDNGDSFSTPGENVKQNSYESGLHLEFGMKYFLTNQYALGLEGRYQMSQSKFRMHNSNFDIDFSGLSLALNLYYHF
ncbi:MAG: outer membrane beta-barrel protein [Candidatus Krumholzibacteriota bacterium]|nr:outer membrane beta-barrel protein [Candidatus Krumholzibacteriota bacterium]